MPMKFFYWGFHFNFSILTINVKPFNHNKIILKPTFRCIPFNIQGLRVKEEVEVYSAQPQFKSKSFFQTEVRTVLICVLWKLIVALSNSVQEDILFHKEQSKSIENIDILSLLLLRLWKNPWPLEWDSLYFWMNKWMTTLISYTKKFVALCSINS